MKAAIASIFANLVAVEITKVACYDDGHGITECLIHVEFPICQSRLHFT